MWAKVKIVEMHHRTGKVRQRRAWSILYRGLAITRRRDREYSVTHLPTGRMLVPATFGTVLDAKTFVDCVYLSIPGFDPSASKSEALGQQWPKGLAHAWNGWAFCWPEIEERRGRVLAELSARRQASKAG
jgi:hypothetical protein